MKFTMIPLAAILFSSGLAYGQNSTASDFSFRCTKAPYDFSIHLVGGRPQGNLHVFLNTGYTGSLALEKFTKQFIAEDIGAPAYVDIGGPWQDQCSVGKNGNSVKCKIENPTTPIKVTLGSTSPTGEPQNQDLVSARNLYLSMDYEPDLKLGVFKLHVENGNGRHQVVNYELPCGKN